jgi:hypothetical protein
MSRLADIVPFLTCNKPEGPEGAEPSRKIDQPLLEAWPAGYEHGSFRLCGDGVLLSAKGKPTLQLDGSDATDTTP